MGSASELEYHLLLARDLKLINPKDYEELVQRAIELKRMLTAPMQKLKAESYQTIGSCEVTSMPYASNPTIFRGWFVNSLIFRSPRSARIWAPMPASCCNFR